MKQDKHVRVKGFYKIANWGAFGDLFSSVINEPF